MLKEINSSKDVITNVDLFNEIIELVKNSKDTALMKCEGELPPFVDYAIPESYVSGIYDYEFDPLFVLSPGYNEGYYLDLGIYGNYTLSDSVNILNLGTIKTLDETEDGIRQMTTLYAECLIAYKSIMNDSSNLDALTRKGFDLRFIDTDGNISNWGYSGIKNQEDALKELHKLHELDPDKYARAIIRDNMTRKEKTYA